MARQATLAVLLQPDSAKQHCHHCCPLVSDTLHLDSCWIACAHVQPKPSDSMCLAGPTTRSQTLIQAQSSPQDAWRPAAAHACAQAPLPGPGGLQTLPRPL